MKHKYLRVNRRKGQLTVLREDVSYLNKKGREKRWDEIDAEYPNSEFISCYETSQQELPCFKRDSVTGKFVEGF